MGDDGDIDGEYDGELVGEEEDVGSSVCSSFDFEEN